jgi:hypothetical protein
MSSLTYEDFKLYFDFVKKDNRSKFTWVRRIPEEFTGSEGRPLRAGIKLEDVSRFCDNWLYIVLDNVNKQFRDYKVRLVVKLTYEGYYDVENYITDVDLLLIVKGTALDIKEFDELKTVVRLYLDKVKGFS